MKEMKGKKRKRKGNEKGMLPFPILTVSYRDSIPFLSNFYEPRGRIIHIH